jgi:hypothetical protein
MGVEHRKGAELVNKIDKDSPIFSFTTLSCQDDEMKANIQ